MTHSQGKMLDRGKKQWKKIYKMWLMVWMIFKYELDEECYVHIFSIIYFKWYLDDWKYELWHFKICSTDPFIVFLTPTWHYIWTVHRLLNSIQQKIQFNRKFNSTENSIQQKIQFNRKKMSRSGIEHRISIATIDRFCDFLEVPPTREKTDI